jgi:hypothetical protein
MSEFRIEHPALQLVVVCQEQEAFAVSVEPSEGINIPREWPEVAERHLSGLTGELGEDSVRLVEEYVVKSERLHG